MLPSPFDKHAVSVENVCLGMLGSSLRNGLQPSGQVVVIGVEPSH